MSEAVAGSLDVQGLAAWLHASRDRLPMFTVYDHPTDWPDFYVARLWFTLPAAEATDLTIMDRDLDRIRVTLEALGLVQLARQDADDPKILETWI